MEAALAKAVRERAGGCCEYCRLPQTLVRLPFQIDHIIAEQHGGPTALSNLAWSRLAWDVAQGKELWRGPRYYQGEIEFSKDSRRSPCWLQAWMARACTTRRPAKSS